MIFMYTLRTDAPWHLARISSKTKLGNQDDTALNFTYNYDSTSGANSDVYIIGTCVNWSICRPKANR